MNRSYKVIWNESLNCFMAVAEYAKARGKSSNSSVSSNSVASEALSSGAKLLRLTAICAGIAASGFSMQAIAADGNFDNVNATGDVTGTNITASGTVKSAQIETTGDVVAVGNVTGADITASGTLKGAQITTTGAFTAGSITTSGNVNAKQVTVQDNATLASGNKQVVTGGQLFNTNQTVNDNKTAADSAIAAVDGRVTTNEDNITTIKTTLGTLGVDASKPGIKYFRANSTKPDAEAIGEDSVAIGPNAKSEGESSLAAGNAAQAIGENSVATGNETKAEGESSLAAGDGAQTTEGAKGAIALGQNAQAGSIVTDPGLADGEGSIAIGRNSVTGGSSSTAVGDGASATASNSAAIGNNAEATGASATALGANANASGGNSIALGNATASSDNAFAAGNGAVANSPDGISLGTGAGVNTSGTVAADQRSQVAIGNKAGQNVIGKETIGIGFGAGSNVKGDNNIAMGTNAGTDINGEYNIAMGFEANKGAGVVNHATVVGGKALAGSNSVALGYEAKAKGTDSVALGNQAEAQAQGLALGSNAKAESDDVALGFNTSAGNADFNGISYLTKKTDGAGVVSVGNASNGLTRRIVNVADGAQGNDAVNVNQLKSAQRSVADLVGGGVLLNENGSYGQITVLDKDENEIKFDNIVEAIGAVTSGEVNILPADAVRYNANGGISNVAAGIDGTDAVNVQQLNEKIAEEGVKYFSVNSTDGANRNNQGASGANAIAIGPQASAPGEESLALGYQARSEGNTSVAIGKDVRAEGVQSTVLGNQSRVYGEKGVAIGHDAVSNGENSLVMGSGAKANEKSTGARVDNAIVIGTNAKSTASEDGIAIGQLALARENRAMAQGFTAQALADDAMAFGSNSKATGVQSTAMGTRAAASGFNAIAQGTDAAASGENASASGTKSNASGSRSIASGKDSSSYATDGVAIGTGAVSGILNATTAQQASNANTIAIGKAASATDLDALAMGNKAQASKQDATAIGRESVASAKDAIAFGREASANKQDAIAFGRGAESNKQGSVALGAGSITDANATKETSATVNGLSYSGFKGQAADAGMQVSVGSAGDERQLKNVAAGAINKDSTDAINGSQLHATNTVLGNVAESARSAIGGETKLNPNGTITTNNVGNTGKNNIHDAIEYAAQGWNVQTNGIASSTTQVKPGETVNFVDGKNIEITNTGKKITVATADDVDFNTVNVDETVTIGDDITNQTVINKGDVSTNNLTVNGTTKLGDNFTVTKNDVKYTGPITDGDHITNKTYVDKVGAASRTEVAAGSNVSNVIKTTGANDQDIYTVNADGTTASAGSDAVTVVAGTKDANNVTDYKVDLSDKTKSSLEDADSALQTIVTQVDGTDVKSLSKDDNNANFVSGNNIQLSDDGKGGISVATKDDVTFTNTTITNDLTVNGTTKLGDNFTVNTDNSVTYNGQEIANKADGLSFKGNTGSAINKTLGDDQPLTVSGELAASEASSGANLRVDGSADKLSLVMARDLTDLDSATFGKGNNQFTINQGGVQFVNKDGDKRDNTPSITVGGIDGGNQQITGVQSGLAGTSLEGAKGDTLLNAVNVGDLQNNITGVIDKGFNIAADNGADDKVKLGETVTYTSADKSIVTTVSNNEIDFALGNDLSVGGPGKDGKDGVDGKLAVDGKDGKTGVTINGEDGTIGLKGKDGANGIISVTNGVAGVDGKDGITRIVIGDNEVATMQDGLKFAGNTGSTIAKQLNETLTVKGNLAEGADASGANLRVDSKDGNLNLVMAKDLTDLDSIIINNGGPVISSTGIDMGGLDVNGKPTNKITNLAPGTEGTDAVNFDQLTKVETAANAGWNVTGSGKDSVNIGPNGKMDFVGDENLTVVQSGVDNDGKIELALSNELTVGGKDGKDGFIGVDGADGTTGVAINGADGSIGLKGKDGANGIISVTNGVAGVDGKDGITRIVIGDNEVATMQDGLKFAGNTGDTINKQLNETLTVKGELADADKASGANLRVDSKDGNLNLVMARDLTQLDSVMVGDSFIDTNGLTITNGPTFTTTKVDVAGNQITNVGSGLGSIDLADAEGDTLNNATNVGDLQGAVTDITDKGFNIAADNSGFADGKKVDNVKLGETVSYTSSDGNIITTVKDNEIDFGLGNDLSVGDDDNPGNIIVKGENGKDGVTINGADGSIGLTGQDGANGIISVTNGVPGVDGKDGITRVVIDDIEVATMKDGLKFAGNTGSTIAKQLNETLTVKGELADTANASGANLRVDSDGNDLNLVMAKDLTDLNSATFGKGNNQFTINQGGVQFVNKDGDKRDNTPSITAGGIDGGNQQITGVESGLTDTTLEGAKGDTLLNAVNVGDLQNNITGVIDKGFNIAADNSGFADGKKVDNVKLGETVKYTSSDGNIITTIKDNEVDFGLGKDLSVGDDENPGTIVVKGENGKDGVTINGADGSIGLTGADGANGIISVTNGVAGVDGKDGITRIVIGDNEVATMKDGLKFAGNTGDTINKQLNETLTVKGELADEDDASGANLRVDSKDGNLNLVMAKNLTDLDSIIINNGGPIISSAGIDMGGKKITKVAAGTEDDDAVNFGQLNKVSGDVSKGLNFTGDDATTVINRQLGDTLNITGGATGGLTNGNIGVVANGNQLEVKMAENIDLGDNGSVTTGDTVVNNDGLTIAGGPSVTKDGIDAGDNKITGVAKGDIAKDSTDAVNGGQLWEVKNDIDKDVAASKTEVTEGKNITVTETKGADGQTIYEVATSDEVAFDKVDVGSVSIDKANVDEDGNTIITGVGAGKADTDAVNVGQLKDVVAGANKGFNISAQGENKSNVGNGGSVDFNNTDGNIKVEKTADSNDISFNLNPNLDLGEDGSVTTGNTKVDNSGVTTGNTSMSNNGITINNAKPDSDDYDESKTVSVTDQGLNNGGNRITNVGPGVSGTDAVNVNQLKDFGYNLSNKIDNVADEANAGVSAAMAMSALPQAYIPGKSMITGGIASYNGQGAAAVGFSKLSDNGRWVLKMSGSADTEGNVGGAVGGGFHF